MILRKKTSVFLFPRKAIGSVEAMLPLIARLATESSARVECTTIATHRDTQLAIQDTPFNDLVFNKLGKTYSFVRPEGSSRTWFGFASLARFLRILLYHRIMSRRLIFIGSVRNDNAFFRLLVFALPAFGRVLWFPAGQAIWDDDFASRLRSDVYDYIRGTGAKTSNLEKFTVRAGLCFTEKEVANYRELLLPRCKLFPIGFPKLYDFWPGFLQRHAQPILQQERERIGVGERPYVVIMLSVMEQYWFRADKSYGDLFADVLAALRETLPDHAILIKAKYWVTDATRLASLIRDDDPVYFTNCNLSVLALEATAAISVHETSGHYDFVCQGVPSFEYWDCTEEWTEVFPQLSAYARLPGVTLLRGEAALREALSDLRSKRAPTSVALNAARASLIEHFSHEDRLLALLRS